MTCQVLSPPSSADVTIITANNATFQDAFQFDDDTDTSWSFANKTFRMDVKSNIENDAPPMGSFTSAASEIVVDDTALRILHFNVPKATLSADLLIPGEYVYDLLMTDTITSVVTPIMHGAFVVTDGVTGV